MRIKSINPATGEILNRYEEFQWEEISYVLDCSLSAFHKWRRETIQFRADLISRLANKLEDKKEALAVTITLEMGKPITQSRAEIEKCAWLCRYYVENSEQFLNSQTIKTAAKHSYVSFQPIGPVLAVMPWNFPFWQVFRFAIPALLAGNSVVLKHASSVSACSLAIEKLFKECRFPDNIFQSLIISSKKVENVITDRRIQAVTFTGSTPAGRAVGSLAGRSLKKSVLELGGSDPYIILADADISYAADVCASARLLNAGQSCISAKRFIVVEEVYDQFVYAITQKLKNTVIGDPLNSETDLGPLARNNLRLDLQMQVNNSVEKGADLILGGADADMDGFYYLPTVLGNVLPGMPAYHEELFGPVAAVIKVANEEQAVCTANDTNFGLGAAVFSADIQNARRIAEFELEAGCCFVNGAVISDPRMPFGGVKDSGYGRELSVYGLYEFMNIKSVVVK
ncbi:NAD-dependent succinate-semialdehyde dehydrogenase [Marinilabiliaceae bacterium ANBcel2]|nr:NAD-dependent succinate-semialdehyde dehydrogenase [Marinilabiliaceae bacterium ANBcel2]